MNLLNNKPTLQLTNNEANTLRAFKIFTENVDNPEAVSFLLDDISHEETENEYFNIQYIEGKAYYVVSVRSDDFGVVSLGVFSTREKAKESLLSYENNNSSERYNCWNEFFKAYCTKSTFILDFDISEDYLDVI